MSPTCEAGDPDSAPAGSSRTARNYALDRRDPWLGGIGFTQAIADSAELGFGVAVPESRTTEAETDVLADLVHAGVGVWLTFDF